MPTRDDRSRPTRRGSAAPVADGPTAAREAGLRYVSDARPGITRRRAGRGFSYRAPDGTPVRDRSTLDRIRGLAIPPAWTDVWICPVANGHIQATGRDARGRKQYRYHARWREVRDAAKYERTLAFAEALPRIRTRVEQDLRRPGLPREKVLGAVVRLLETTALRVGNAEYARDNQSFGLTTLRGRHAEVEGSAVRFRFRGKGGKVHEAGLRDRRLASVVRRCQELPGQELFAYLGDDGQPVDVTSTDVNDYLREIGGDDFTAKDFRTWAGTLLAARALQKVARERRDDASASERDLRREVVRAIDEVARSLGNTPAVCRRCYVHPAILEAHLDGATLAAARRRRGGMSDRDPARPDADADEEATVIVLLRQRLALERSGEAGARGAARAASR